MSKEADRAEALRREIVGAIVQGADVGERFALPLASSIMAYLQREYGGQRIYIPQPARQYDELQIRAALERGDTPAKVCKDHAISRSTLYGLFPGGLPKPRAEALG